MLFANRFLMKLAALFRRINSAGSDSGNHRGVVLRAFPEWEYCVFEPIVIKAVNSYKIKFHYDYYAD